jgi:hypothetical protein
MVSMLGEALAEEFERVNGEVVAFVEGLSDQDWQTWCDREGRRVGVVVYHIAAGHLFIAEHIEAITRGAILPTPGPATDQDAAQANAEQAQEHACCTHAEALDLLGRNGAQVIAMLRGLTDEQLNATQVVLGEKIGLKERIERWLFGHATGHLAALRETVGR